MRWIWTIGAWLATSALVVPLVFLIVLFAAGPHAGLLPKPLEIVVFILGWAAVLLLPLLAARKVWRRCGSRQRPN